MSSLSNLSDYLQLHSDELGERILGSYPPLHGLDDAPSPALSQMLRTPYPAQSLAIMGVANRWQIARSAHVVVTFSKSWPSRPYFGLSGLRPLYGL